MPEQIAQGINRDARRAWAYLSVTLLWAALAAGGFPFPHMDDPFFVGAGLNLAQGGSLVNPLMEGTTHFYSYPPLQSYLLAGWLKLFGVSVGSMVAMYVVISWAATLFVIRTFQILNREFLGVLVALCVVIYATSSGMRPDDFALFFAALSFRLGVSPGARFRFFAPCCAFLAMCSTPAAMAIMLPWIVYLAVTDKSMWKAILAGAAATAALIGAMVDWKVTDFLTGFLYNNHDAHEIVLSWLETYWDRPMGLVKLFYPTVTICTVIFLAASRRGFRVMDAVALLSLVLGLYTIFNTVSGHRVLGIITVIAIGYYIDLLAPHSRWNRILVAANALLIAASGVRPLVQGVSTRRTADGPALLHEIQRIHPARIIMDDWSLRYVFNYHLIPGMTAINYSDADHSRSQLASQKFPDECWVLSAESVRRWQLPPHGLPVPRYVSFAGKHIGDWLSNAGEIGVSPPGK